MHGWSFGRDLYETPFSDAVIFKSTLSGCKPVKVAFFSNFHQPCGIADYSKQLLDELTKLVDVKVVQSPLAYQIKYNYSSYFYYANKFRQCALEMNKADICHIQHDYSFWGGVKPLRNLFPYMASAIRLPVVLTAHEIINPPFKMADFKGAMKWLPFVLSPCSRRYSVYVSPGIHQWADMTIVHTRQQLDILTEQGVSSGKISVIPHGIPPCRSLASEVDEIKRRFRFTGRRLLTIIGFISSRKGYELVLNVLPFLPDDVMFVIAGGCRTEHEESYLSGLRESIERSGLSQRVVITGYLEEVDLHAVVKTSDVILAPFKTVTGSGTLSMAIALGKPVIASNLAPMLELNKSARSMLLFAAGDSEDLLAKIQLLLSNEQLSAEMSTSALRYAAENSMQAIARQTVALYERVLIARSK